MFVDLLVGVGVNRPIGVKVGMGVGMMVDQSINPPNHIDRPQNRQEPSRQTSARLFRPIRPRFVFRKITTQEAKDGGEGDRA